jgi:hypothetical protein
MLSCLALPCMCDSVRVPLPPYSTALPVALGLMVGVVAACVRCGSTTPFCCGCVCADRSRVYVACGAARRSPGTEPITDTSLIPDTLTGSVLCRKPDASVQYTIDLCDCRAVCLRDSRLHCTLPYSTVHTLVITKFVVNLLLSHLLSHSPERVPRPSERFMPSI